VSAHQIIFGGFAMGALTGGIDLLVNFLKNFSVYGISLWFIVRTTIFMAIVVWPIYELSIRMLTGSSDD